MVSCGSNCRNYLLFDCDGWASAPDTLEFLGDKQFEIMKLRLEVQKQIEESKEFLEEVKRKRDEACDGQP
jgi:hypothetical protein